MTSKSKSERGYVKKKRKKTKPKTSPPKSKIQFQLIF